MTEMWRVSGSPLFPPVSTRSREGAAGCVLSHENAQVRFCGMRVKTAGPSRVDAETLPDKMKDEDGGPKCALGARRGAYGL